MSAPSLLLAAVFLFGLHAQPVDEPFPPASPEAHGLRAETLSEIDALVRGLAEKGRIVGAELLIIKDRRTVFHRAHGWSDREEERPMQPNTLFNLRSMAKPLVGTAAQMLIDDGTLERDAPIAAQLSSFAEGASSQITLRHLLAHRSGLPDTTPPLAPSAYDGLRGVADHWGAVGPTVFAPGTDFAYSDPGADVLGALIAAASKEPLEGVVTRRVLAPLGMTETLALTADEHPLRERFASGYLWSEGQWERFWKPGDAPLVPFVRGAGDSWYGTPRDYARFLCLWMDDGLVGERRLLSPEAIARALEPVSPMPYSNRLSGLRVTYGEMWQVYVSRDDGRLRAFGHSGSDGTYAWAWPQEDLMVFYFTQSRGQRTRLQLEPLLGRLLVKEGAAEER